MKALFFAHVATSVHRKSTAVCAPEWAPVAAWSVWELLAIVVLVSVGGLFVASRLLSAGHNPHTLTGKDLDRVASSYGLARAKRWLWFRESDKSLRRRVLARQFDRFSADRVRRTRRRDES